MLTYDQALNQLTQLAHELGEPQHESISIYQAGGRVSAQDIVAAIPVPTFANSAMDGFAVRSAEIQVGKALAVSQRIAAGFASPDNYLLENSCAEIYTGAAIPVGADAVVMIERTSQDGDKITFHHAPNAGENIRTAGSDIQQGQVLVKKGTRLTPAMLGLLASTGMADVSVFKRLRIGLFATGNELVEPGQNLPYGGVFNVNRVMLCSMLQRVDVDVFDLGTLPDERALIRTKLLDAAKSYDVIMTAGGISMGGEDHIRAVLSEIGRIDIWKIAIKPGKPMAIGRIENCTVIGLPGNPVSALVTFKILAHPFLLARAGGTHITPTSYTLPAAFSWKKVDDKHEFLRAKINSNHQVEIYPDQKSGVLSSCAWADGLVRVSPHTAIEIGDLVTYFPFG